MKFGGGIPGNRKEKETERTKKKHNSEQMTKKSSRQKNGKTTT